MGHRAQNGPWRPRRSSTTLQRRPCASTRSHLRRDSSRVGAGTRLSREAHSAMSQPEKSFAYASWHLRANAWMNQRDGAAGANGKSKKNKSVANPLGS
jgi:hypothetical protein